MRFQKPSYFKKEYFIFVVIIFVLGILATIQLPFNETIEDWTVDLQFKIRGERELARDIVLVFIGTEDIHALGGWEITRDYYVYITHFLKSSGARVIGFDLLFSTPALLYPEFDNTMAVFFRAAGNVCLPMVFEEQQITDIPIENRTIHGIEGRAPVWPLAALRRNVAGVGFSNLMDEAIIRKVPLFAASGDSVLFSFGVELARLYLGLAPNQLKLSSDGLAFPDTNGHTRNLPFDRQGCLQLNHFGGHHRVNAVSLVDILQIAKSNPDSLDFNNKLILIAVTAPGTTILKATPFSPALPAALIHATLAENIIYQNYLQTLPKFWNWVLIAILVLGAILLGQIRPKKLQIAGGFCLILLFWLITIIAFARFELVLPVFYPSIAYFAVIIRRTVSQRKRVDSANRIQKDGLQEQIATTQSQLTAAEKQFVDLQHQARAASRETAKFSGQQQELIRSQKQKVINLEKQLEDLQAFKVASKALAQTQFPEIIHAKESKMTEILALIAKIGSDDIPVLLLGETGTGKEMIARAIHQSSSRNTAPFVAINCGALPETLLESELFGHVKGSFTGAQSQRRGRFELADRGTLFLDEITETSAGFQARLLRVLQEGAFERVGGEKTIQVNVRMIAASNRNLKQEVTGGTFRADLFYRLNGFPIMLPSLSERSIDIPLLANFFLKKYKYRSISRFSNRAMDILLAHAWPGNVRELENVVRRAAILAQSDNRTMIQLKDLPADLTRHQSNSMISAIHQPLEKQILEMLRQLKFSHASIHETAKALGNRDRGTITEYFRGICFEHLVKADFNLAEAVQSIAKTDDEAAKTRVQKKIESYLNKLKSSLSDNPELVNDESQRQTGFKGLPKMYHPYLEKVLKHLSDKPGK